MVNQTLLLLLLLFTITITSATDFASEMGYSWGEERVKFKENGTLLQLQLDKNSDSGYQFKNQYLYGRFDMQIKVVPGNSAGTVTSFNLQSPKPNNNEVQFEFLGNVSQDKPYVLHTNLFVRGIDDKEQQFYLWFDPRDDFHNYTILWNPHHIVWLVDSIPIRLYPNTQMVSFPNDQPLNVTVSIWNGQEWATRRGREKIDWAEAPFRAWFRNFTADACTWSSSGRHECPPSDSGWPDRMLSHDEKSKLKWARENFLIRDYCLEPAKSDQGLPKECSYVVDDD